MIGEGATTKSEPRNRNLNENVMFALLRHRTVLTTHEKRVTEGVNRNFLSGPKRIIISIEVTKP